MRILLLIALIIFNSFVVIAQHIKIRAGAIFIPVSSALANIGVEQINKTNTASWHLNYAVSNGSIALDAGETKRRWVTIDRIWYKAGKGKVQFVYGLFTEMGSRIKYPGFIHPAPDSIPVKSTYFEISPGAVIGFNWAFSKKVGLQLFSGPKLIIATKGNQQLYNSNTKENFYTDVKKNITAGLRIMGGIYYQFQIKRSSR